MPAPYDLTCLRCLRLATRGACANEFQCLRRLRHAEEMPASYYFTCLRRLRLATRGACTDELQCLRHLRHFQNAHTLPAPYYV